MSRTDHPYQGAEHTPGLNEPELADDYPIYADYLYVADGRVYRSGWHGITARQLKGREGFKTLRRCDIEGRRSALSKAQGMGGEQ